MPVRLLFAGTPSVALPALETLLAGPHEVQAVLTRPDAAAGRGRRTRSSPVAARAEQAGVEVLRPASPRDPDFQRRLAALAPDCAPVVAYGALLPEPALAVPVHGWVNLHFSLLPAWRGAAPVQHALLAGDDTTGATTFRLVRELDAGPVFGTTTEAVRPDDTAGDLLDRLAVSGAELLAATLDGIEAGRLVPVEQPAEGVSFAPRLQVDDARVRWDDPAFAVDRRVRACTPAPGAWTTLSGERLKLGPVALVEPADPVDPVDPVDHSDPTRGTALAPGELSAGRQQVLVGTATAPVRLGEVQPAGKQAMPAAAWARGARLSEHARLGT
jgi:methionyl-tRNA formyltransferase